MKKVVLFCSLRGVRLKRGWGEMRGEIKVKHVATELLIVAWVLAMHFNEQSTRRATHTIKLIQVPENLLRCELTTYFAEN